jgi:hypothetical protein
MSFSLLDLHRSVAMAQPAAPTPTPVEEPVAAVADEPIASEEFEFVLGRRQVAGLSFVSIVALMVCVAIAYLAGKSTVPKPATPAPVVIQSVTPAPIVKPQPVIPGKPAPVAAEAPLFADPVNGLVYIQMGAVEKGIAVIFAEGLRKRGLPGFVAPGPTPTVFRVLIGPLPDAASFVKAKDMVDKIGLSTFARKYP